MMTDGSERVTLINCTDDEEERREEAEEREGCRACHICCEILRPFVFLLRILILILECMDTCVSNCCSTFCCECIRGCVCAVRTSCCRGLRSLMKHRHDCYRIYEDTYKV